MTDRFESMKKTFNESHKNMSKEGVVGFANKILDYGAGREKANVAADIFIADLLVTQQGKIDELKKQDWTIEYSRKVKLPQFVADWLEQSKGFDEDCQAYDQDNAMTLQNSIDVDTGGITKDIVEWLWHLGNDELFARAWLDGYEVEEEPTKYYVKVGEKLYFKSWGEDGQSPEFIIDYHLNSKQDAYVWESKEVAQRLAVEIDGTVEEVTNG